MAQTINMLSTDECQLNLDLTGDYDVMLNSITGTMNIPIVVKNEDYVVWNIGGKTIPTADDVYDFEPIKVTFDRLNLETGETTETKYDISVGTRRCVVGNTIYITSTFSTIQELIRQFYDPDVDQVDVKPRQDWEKFSCLIDTEHYSGHLRFKCSILDASPRMKYVLGIRHTWPTFPDEEGLWRQLGMGIVNLRNLPRSERPPYLLGSPYYFIYVENAKCRSRFFWKRNNLVWYHDDDKKEDPNNNIFVVQDDNYGLTKPDPSAQENFDETYNQMTPQSLITYQKQLYNKKYLATQQILNVIYNSFSPGNMFQFSGGQFTCSGETLPNVRIKIVGMFGEPMNNYSEVLWSFQLAPTQPPQPPPGVTKEGLAQLEAQKAEQAQQAALAQQQAQQAQAAGQGDMETMAQMIMELKEENQKLLKMMMDQNSQINNAIANDTKEDVQVAQKFLPRLPQYVGAGPSVNPFKPQAPITPVKPVAPIAPPEPVEPKTEEQPEQTEEQVVQQIVEAVAQGEATAQVPVPQPAQVPPAQEVQQNTPV